MMREAILPLAALLACAGVLGLIWGLRAVPPGETALIDAAAAEYIAETGGTGADCHARPSALPEVRLVVICGADWIAPLDQWGNRVEIDLSQDGEPQT